jgi:hypothetical protein
MSLFTSPGRDPVRAADRWLIVGPLVFITMWIGLTAWSLSLLGGMMTGVVSASRTSDETRARVAVIAPAPGGSVFATARSEILGRTPAPHGLPR